MAFPIAAIVVSPAESRDRTSSGATSAVISPLSTESHIAAPMLPSDSASRADRAVIQGTTLRGLCHRRLDARVARPDGIEDHVTIGPQMIETIGPETDGLGKHAQRVSLGDILDRVDAATGGQFVGQRLRRRP